jgi:hypothetical protein
MVGGRTMPNPNLTGSFRPSGNQSILPFVYLAFLYSQDGTSYNPDSLVNDSQFT